MCNCNALLHSPSSRVLFTMGALKGPGPSLVYALTLMVYSTYSSNSPSSTISTDPLVVVSLVEGISSNVLWLTSTSYWMMIPFLDISGTGSHVTKMAVEERVRTCTFSGGAFGATEVEKIGLNTIFIGIRLLIVSTYHPQRSDCPHQD